MDRYQLGSGLALDAGNRTLLRGGRPVALPPKTFDLLLLLVRYAGRLVRKQEIFASVWPGAAVTEASLTNQIAAIRKALGPAGARWIETASKQGYRFVGPAEAVLPSNESGIAMACARIDGFMAERSPGSVRRAHDLCIGLIDAAPARADLWARYGRIHQILAKFDEHREDSLVQAEGAYLRAFALNPREPAAHAHYTSIECDLGRAASALERLEREISLSGPSAPLLTGLVQVYRFAGRLEESLHAHEQAERLQPRYPTSVAHTLFAMGDYRQALEYYTVPYYLDVACHAALGDLDRAIELLDARLPTVTARSVIGCLMHSLRLILAGEKRKALALMDHAHREWFREPEAQYYLARHYAYLGEPAGARRLLRACAARGFRAFEAKPRGEDPWLNSKFPCGTRSRQFPYRFGGLGIREFRLADRIAIE